MKKPTKPELYAKVDDLTRRVRAAERVALSNYRRWAVLATTVEGWATTLSIGEPSERLSAAAVRGLREAVDRPPRDPGDPHEAADRVLLFLATRSLGGNVVMRVDDDVSLTVDDLQTLIGAALELEARKDFHG